jgi:hypothetical protein
LKIFLLFHEIVSFFNYFYQGDIAIDDIARLMGSCQEPNTCDFESGTFCGWENDKKTDQFEWEITNGPSSETLATGNNQIRINFKISIVFFSRSIY